MNNIIDGLSKDIEQTEKDKLRTLFPQCFVEGKLDIDKLLNLCGEYIDDDSERYRFTWHGKNESLKLAQKRTLATLRPCREESVDFDTTKNLYLEGDNLEVLKLLQAPYYHKIKMIYIDPPYNTGNDFVYEDDFADSMAKYKEITSQTTKSNPETMGRFHTNWLNMMYPRLRLAANLLRDDGVIFISIDDNEVYNLCKLCDEVFGEENFAGMFPWRKRTAKSDVPFGISQDYEWILCYAKSDKFSACLEGGTKKYYESDDLPNRPWRIHDLTKQTTASERPKSFFTIINPKTGMGYPANPNRTWAITVDTFDKYYRENRIVFPDDYGFLNITKPVFRYFKEDDMAKAGDRFGFIPVSTKLPDDIGMTQDGTKEITELFENKIFGFPKPAALINYLVNAATSTSKDKEEIILDLFSGSSTTAHAVMQLNAEDGGNRRFIMVQLPEICEEKSEAFKTGYHNICEIGKERIRRAGAKIKAEQEAKSSLLPFDDESSSQLDIGFKVFKLDTSNLNTWDSSPILDDDLFSLQTRMNAMLDKVKSDRTDLDMVYEVMLKMGIQPTEAVTTLDICGKKAYCVCDDCQLLVCLAEGVTTEMVEQMADYAPARIIFGQECFNDVSALSNAKLTLQNRGIEFNFI